ncbi:MAG: aquaporin [Candidatus Poribacteria bacterium]|nr:aquaporin [Candidatus Poribacteria bacterium]
MSSRPPIAALIAEFLGSMFLVMAAISPIILFHQVLDAGIGVAVVADALAVGFILFALIELFAPISGAHFNPAVSFAFWFAGEMPTMRLLPYVGAQLVGGLWGTVAAHGMFYHLYPTLVEVSAVERSGGNHLAELFGTFLLVLTVLVLSSRRSERTPLVVGLLVGGQLMATSSTMFANPQVTLARMFTYSAAGVRPADGAMFVVMELVGASLAVWLSRILLRSER